MRRELWFTSYDPAPIRVAFDRVPALMGAHIDFKPGWTMDDCVATETHMLISYQANGCIEEPTAVARAVTAGILAATDGRFDASRDLIFRETATVHFDQRIVQILGSMRPDCQAKLPAGTTFETMITLEEGPAGVMNCSLAAKASTDSAIMAGAMQTIRPFIEQYLQGRIETFARELTEDMVRLGW